MGSLLELEQTVRELKEKLLANEIATNLLFNDVLVVLEKLSPDVTNKMLTRWKAAQDSLPDTFAGKDPHTKIAITRIIRVLEGASKK